MSALSFFSRARRETQDPPARPYRGNPRKRLLAQVRPRSRRRELTSGRQSLGVRANAHTAPGGRVPDTETRPSSFYWLFQPYGGAPCGVAESSGSVRPQQPAVLLARHSRAFRASAPLGKGTGRGRTRQSSLVEHWTHNPEERVQIPHSARGRKTPRGAGHEPALQLAGRRRRPATGFCRSLAIPEDAAADVVRPSAPRAREAAAPARAARPCRRGTDAAAREGPAPHFFENFTRRTREQTKGGG